MSEYLTSSYCIRRVELADHFRVADYGTLITSYSWSEFRKKVAKSYEAASNAKSFVAMQFLSDRAVQEAGYKFTFSPGMAACFSEL